MRGLQKLRSLVELDEQLQPQLISSVYVEKISQGSSNPSETGSAVERLAMTRVRLLEGLNRVERFRWTTREVELLEEFLCTGRIKSDDEFDQLDALVDSVIHNNVTLQIGRLN